MCLADCWQHPPVFKSSDGSCFKQCKRMFLSCRTLNTNGAGYSKCGRNHNINRNSIAIFSCLRNLLCLAQLVLPLCRSPAQLISVEIEQVLADQPGEKLPLWSRRKHNYWPVKSQQTGAVFWRQFCGVPRPGFGGSGPEGQVSGATSSSDPWSCHTQRVSGRLRQTRAGWTAAPLTWWLLST